MRRDHTCVNQRITDTLYIKIMCLKLGNTKGM